MYIVIILLVTLFIISTIFILLLEHVNKHSTILKEIKHLNEKYHFQKINDYHFKHFYDNEHSFESIEPIDYLVYQLQFEQKYVKEDISKTLENLGMYEMYIYEINELKKCDPFDIPTPKYVVSLTKKIIKKKLKDEMHKPTIDFKIIVTLYRTTINDRIIAYKSGVFDVLSVEEIIERLNNRTYDRYNDPNIWDSICKIERGKVSNKMRFAVYAKDGYRCKKCGRVSNDLEIDHIIPISKGGKSTFDNLQTLCRSCNKAKSNYIERDSFDVGTNTLICPKCGAPLKLKKGKYGSFYGCMNYPKCTYIKR